MYKIFDAHTHTYPEKISAKACENLGEFYDFKVWGKGTYSDLETQAKECGVAGFMLFSVATNATQVPKVNDSIASLAKISRAHGFEAVGYAGMHQDYPDFAGELDRALGLGLRGVKLHPDIQRVDIDDPRMLRLYLLMEERGMTLFLHMGDNRPQYRYSEPKKLAHVLELFPSLRVVAAHMGGYKAWDEAEKYLWGNKNVWYDISSTLWAMPPQTAAALIRKCGYDRVMFGTDYPVYNLRDYIDLFMKLDLTEQQRADILYNNASKFFDLAHIAELDA